MDAITSGNTCGALNKAHKITDEVWVETPLYILHESDHNIITSPTGWLNDKIITASRELLKQHFPDVDGLEPPTLEQINGFQAHTGTFAQVLNMKSNHWILVSNLGCENNTVHVYNTMHSSLPMSTVDTIARLAFCSSDVLTIKMVDVSPQKNSSDCGVLCVAIAFDILSARAPCVANYDHKLLREHLSNCLNNCFLTPFPVIGHRSLTDIHYKFTLNVELYCVCRMPEHPGEEDMAERENCHKWFHQHCASIPEGVFDEDIQEPWECPECSNKTSSKSNLACYHAGITQICCD